VLDTNDRCAGFSVGAVVFIVLLVENMRAESEPEWSTEKKGPNPATAA
jgi:hypothetical protein